MTASEIPVRTNLAVLGVLAALNLVLLVALPFLLAQSGWWALLLVPIVLSTTPMWSLIHEGIHGNLHPDAGINERLARATCIAFGSPFQLLRLGHLMHHRFNRSELNRPEIAEPATARERLRYYVLLLGGLWIGEFLASVLAMLPDRFYRQIILLGFGDETPDGKSMWAAAKRQLLEEPGRTKMRLDGAAITLIYLAAFVHYGAWWWVLVLALYGRALMISFLDNAYHYANPLNEPMAGHNLALPGWLSRGMLHYNFHAVHHARPQAPWSALPEVFSRDGHRYGDDFAPAALRQLRGPLEEGGYEARSSHLPRGA
ncbi:fatty acid desaturase family protein [Roseobacter sp. HKCCA0434]|uniref:fatty acid desaturase family protein n=1 Tax=Roseobacter sp. HKCCA0434 TaxID=3079297 RepID=UPI002905F5D2|nr:fatty acid desaturase [Roseobacter sp. HKCCA0434]